MKAWRKKSLENVRCYGSHSIQARIWVAYGGGILESDIPMERDIVGLRIAKRIGRKRRKKG